MGIHMMTAPFVTLIQPSVASEILRPNASGDVNGILHEVGAPAPNHYLNVDEVVPDEDASMVLENSAVMLYDLYHLTPTKHYREVLQVVVHGRFKADQVNFAATHEPEFTLKSGTTTRNQDIPTYSTMQNGVWSDHEWVLLTDPDPSAAWTKAALDDLQVGPGLVRCRFSSLNWEYCTQIYVEIIYA